MYLQLFRTGNAVMGVIGVLVACFMAAGLNIADEYVNLIISAVVVFMFICGGNAINDYVDHEIDRTAHPERPIPSGRMKRENALYAGLIMLFGSVLVSLLTRDLECIIIVIVACVLMIAYETCLKQRGLIGNITIAVLTGMMFLLGGAVVGAAMDNIIVAAMASLVTVGREITKDIEDMNSDEGRVTLPMTIGVRNASFVASAFYIAGPIPMTIGVRNASFVASAFYIAGPILSIQPMIAGTYGVLYYTVIIADIMFVMCAVYVFKDPHKSQRLAKKAMFVALISFILEVF